MWEHIRLDWSISGSICKYQCLLSLAALCLGRGHTDGRDHVRKGGHDDDRTARHLASNGEDQASVSAKELAPGEGSSVNAAARS